MALHLCASAGQKTGFGALRKCVSDASYNNTEPVCVCEVKIKKIRVYDDDDEYYLTYTYVRMSDGMYGIQI